MQHSDVDALKFLQNPSFNPSCVKIDWLQQREPLDASWLEVT
jgi:hypothetical protein